MRQIYETGTIAVRIPGRSVALLLAVFFGLACQSVAAQLTQQPADIAVAEVEQAMFTKGQTHYNQGLYGEAIVILNEFLVVYPHSAIKDLSLLWLGRSYLGQGDIANAEKIELRLRDVPDTALMSLYEDELRIARQNYAKAAAPSHSSRKEVAHTTADPAHDRSAPPALTSGLAHDSEPRPQPVAAIAPKLLPTIDLKEQVLSTDAPPIKAPIPLAAAKSAAVSGSANVPVVRREAEQRNEPRSLAQSNSKVTASSPPIMPPPATVSAPALQSRFEQVPGAVADGHVSYRLVMVNEGNGSASDLTIRVELDRSLAYAGSDLLPVRQELVSQRQILTFRLSSLAAGQTTVLQISVKPRENALATTGTKHTIFYKDSRGSFHLAQ